MDEKGEGGPPAGISQISFSGDPCLVSRFDDVIGSDPSS